MLTSPPSPFDSPAADVVEVHHGDELDLVALLGEHRHIAYVSVTDAPAVRVTRRRPGLWRCDEHRYPKPPCRHVADVLHTLDHLATESTQTSHPRTEN